MCCGSTEPSKAANPLLRAPVLKVCGHLLSAGDCVNQYTVSLQIDVRLVSLMLCRLVMSRCMEMMHWLIQLFTPCCRQGVYSAAASHDSSAVVSDQRHSFADASQTAPV